MFAAVVIALWGVVTHGTHAGSGDEPHYLAIAHSIAFDFDLDLSNNYGKDEPLIADGGLEPGNHARPGVGGVLRPVHDVGMPLLFAPYVRVAAPLAARSIPHASSPVMRGLRLNPTTLYRHLLGIPMILLAAWMAVMLRDTLVDQDVAARAASLWAILVALSPPLLVMSFLFFTELLSALFCLAAFRVLTTTAPRRTAVLIGAGLLAGLLVLVHIRNIGLVTALCVVAVASAPKQGRSASLAWFAAGLLPLLVLRTVINYLFWGAVATSPHARAGEWTGVTETLLEVGRRTAGLLVDQEFGLLPYAPLYLLAAFGMVALVRRRSARAAHASLILLAYVFTIVFPPINAHGWTGGWSPAARFLTPVIPLLAIGLAGSSSLIPRALIVAFVTVQIGLNAYFWQNPKNLWNDGDGTAAVCARGSYEFCGYIPSLVPPYRVDEKR